MSGEAGVDVLTGQVGSPLAMGADIPRVLYPLQNKLKWLLGSDVAEGVDATAQAYMMEAFYKEPRVAMERVEDDTALSLLLPESDDWIWMKVQQPDPREAHAVPIAGDPALRARVKKAREVFRRPRVKSLFHDEVVRPILDQMIVFYDDEENAIAGAVAIPEEGEAGKLLTVVPIEEALRKAHVSMMQKRKADDLIQLFTHAETYLGPGSAFAQATGHDATIPQFLVQETAFRTLELLKKFHNDPKTLEHIYAICSSPATEGFVSFCESADDIARVASLVERNPSWLMKLAQAYSTLGHDTITAGDPEKFLWEKPLAQHIYQLGHDLIGNALFHHNDPGFRQDFVDASMAALHDTLNMLHGINLPAKLPKEQTMFQGLADYAAMYADDPVALSLLTPIVEQLTLLKIQRIIPGEFAKAREYFYTAIGSALNAHSNEATGDDKLQLSMLVDIFTELTELGYWKAGYILQDVMSGNGKRILEPFLDSDVMKQNIPGMVYAVDGLSYPQPSHGKWLQVVMDATAEDYPEIHARHTGKPGARVHAKTAIWSGFNDGDALEQDKILRNEARSLKKRQGDEPGGVLIVEVPMGYVDAMLEEAERIESREMGRAPLHYPIGGDKTLDKPLEIVKVHDMLVKAKRAGFRPLNLPPGKGIMKTPAFYRTSAGKERAYFVFECVGDPESTLAELALESGKVLVGSGRPDRPV